MEVVGDGVLVDLGQRAFLGADRAGEIAEVVDCQRDIGVERFADRLAVVPGFGDRDGLEVLLDAVGDLVEDHRPLGGRGLAPRRRGGMRGVQRLLDIGLVGAGHLAEHLAGDRAGGSRSTGRPRARPTHRRCSCRSGAAKDITEPSAPGRAYTVMAFSCLFRRRKCVGRH